MMFYPPAAHSLTSRSTSSSSLLFLSLRLAAIIHSASGACLPCQHSMTNWYPSRATNTHAPSIAITPRDAYSPHITQPDKSTTWIVGSSATIHWSCADMPDSLTDPYGQIILGKHKEGSPSEHLDILNKPLAEGFVLCPKSPSPSPNNNNILHTRNIHSKTYAKTNSITVQVPSVPPGSYFIVLFGDSGNRSPTFEIKDPPAAKHRGT